MKFTNSHSYSVRVGDVVVKPGESIGEPAETPRLSKSKKQSIPLEPTAPVEGAELSEEDAS